MKKILSLTMILMIIISSVAYAMPTDVVGTTYEASVERMMSLGMLKGYPDGTFKPNATITRAEFAAVVVRALGLELAANEKRKTKFPDVNESHWASGYISIAAGLDIIKGYTSGNFGPSDPVTYEQSVAMVVRALGYEPTIAAKGGYPAGYLVVASERGMLEGITGKVGNPAPRGLVANLVNNALEVPLMVQVTTGDTTQYVVSGFGETTVQTLLSQKLGLLKADKTVQKVDVANNEMTFVDDSSTYTGSTGIKLNKNLENLNVSILYKKNEIYAVAINSQVIYGYIEGASHSATEVKLVGGGKTYTVDSNAKSTLNGGAATQPAFVGVGYDGGYGKFIINKNNKITRGEVVTQLNSLGVLTSVTDKTAQYINLKTASGATVTLGNMDEAKYNFVAIDGKMANYSDLKEGMLLQYYKDSKDAYSISANTYVVQGVFKSIKADLLEITVDSKTYALSEDAQYSLDKLDTILDLAAPTNLETLEGSVVSLYKDAYDKVVMISGLENLKTTSFYGVLKEANTFNEALKIEQVVEGKIKLVQYKYKLAVDYADVKSGNYTSIYNGGLDATDLYKFVVDENGVVIEIKTVEGITNSATSITVKSIDQQSNSIYGTNLKRFFVEEDVTILSIDGGVVSAMTWAEMEASKITEGSITLYLPTGDSLPKIVFVFNDVNNELGTYFGDYILAYAQRAPSLSAGKLKGTVNTMAGNIDITVEGADLNGWTQDKTVMIVQKKSNGNYTVVDSEQGNDFFLADGLTALDDHYTDIKIFDAVAANVTLVDGTFITIGGTVYKFDEHAMIYQSKNDGLTMDAHLSSDITAGDTATFVTKNEVIQLIIFKK